MAARIVTVEPSLASSRTTSIRSYSRPPRRGADLIERLNDLEHEKRSRRHSHAGALVLARPGPDRSVQEINDEIRALEAEKQAYRYENRAAEERDIAHRYRERASSEAPRSRYASEREVVVETADDGFRRSRSRYGSERGLIVKEELSRDYIYDERRRSKPPAELVVYDEERYGPREIVYERARSPLRNVVRVQKDRKGRLSLVRSAR